MRQTMANTDENNLLFALWLCSKGVVDPESAYKAYNYRQLQKPGLEEIAVFNGLLTVQQSIEIQGLLLGTNRQYGETAVKLGFLTEADLKTLLLIQVNSLPTLIESFYQLMKIDKQSLLRAQECFMETGLAVT